MFILCYRQGRVYPLKVFILEMSLTSKVLLLEMKVSSVSGREDLALRAKNKLSSVSGREVKCEVLVIWKVNNS